MIKYSKVGLNINNRFKQNTSIVFIKMKYLLEDKMKYFKLTALAFLLLIYGKVLVAQGGIAKTLYVEFSELSCYSSYEAHSQFLMDYNQYQLRFMEWVRGGSHAGGCHNARIIFNATTIDVDEIVYLLHSDSRVNRAWHMIDFPRSRQLAILLTEDTNESAFIDSYADALRYRVVFVDERRRDVRPA